MHPFDQEAAGRLEKVIFGESGSQRGAGKKKGAVGKLQAAFDLDSTLSGLEADLSGPKVKEASQTAVSEVMSPIKATVDAGDSLAKALFLMIKEEVGRMPVMQEEKVVGIIRLSDLFQEISDFVLSD